MINHIIVVCNQPGKDFCDYTNVWMRFTTYSKYVLSRWFGVMMTQLRDVEVDIGDNYFFADGHH